MSPPTSSPLSAKGRLSCRALTMEETVPEALQPSEFPIMLPALGVSVCALKDPPQESYLLPSLPQGRLFQENPLPSPLPTPYVKWIMMSNLCLLVHIICEVQKEHFFSIFLCQFWHWQISDRWLGKGQGPGEEGRPQMITDYGYGFGNLPAGETHSCGNCHGKAGWSQSGDQGKSYKFMGNQNSVETPVLERQSDTEI